MKSSFIHNIRFYKPKPKAIYCMCLHSKNNRLALSRSDSSIEIWNLNNAPFIERTISSTVENFSIEGLAWFQDRLFSVGLHGLLVEYDLVKLTICNKSTVTGEAAFCLDIDEENAQIAIGTEQGYLNIFDIVEDGVLYNKFLDKQDGRILCLKYDSTGVFIVSGGLDAIRIWDVKSGHALHKLTTGRSEANRPTIIWCLCVTSDFTIISGDSRGKLTFWDGKVGSQIESYQSHKSDILSLCISENESSLYCSGVDSNIINFVKIQMKNGQEKWVRSIHKKIHDHDVRSLVLNGDKLFSGGTDAYLSLSYDQPKTLVEYPPVLQNPCITLCRKARFIMLRYPKYIEIWSLGETENKGISGTVIPLTKEPKKLMVLRRIVKDHNRCEKKEGIIFSTMSDDGKWIAYGTQLGLRVFQFVYNNEETAQLLRVMENFDSNNDIHLRGLFSSDSSELVCAISGGGINIYGICNDSVSLGQKLETGFKDTITHLLVSDNGNCLAAADSSSNIICWQRKQNQWKFYCKLPTYSCPPTALSLHPSKQHLLIIYADNRIIEYDMENKAFTSLSKDLKNSLPQNWATRFYAIRNIFYNLATNHIILHDDNSMMSIDLAMNPSNSEKKQVKKKKTENDGNIRNFRAVRKYKHLVYLGLLSDGEMVAVEVNPLSLLEQLPPVLIRNKFGTK